MHTHISVTHTPLAAVLIFNEYLNLKKLYLLIEGASLVLLLSEKELCINTFYAFFFFNPFITKL